VAFTASGQSIIVDKGAANPATTPLTNGRAAVLEFVADFEGAAGFDAEWAAGLTPCLEQQSCECIEAQASPDTTMAAELAGDMASFAAASATIFSQPSMQPPPAIQKATASASVTRTILVEESNLIAMLSLNRARICCRGTMCSWVSEPGAVATGSFLSRCLFGREATRSLLLPVLICEDASWHQPRTFVRLIS